MRATRIDGAIKDSGREWQVEKAYRERRANELFAEMEQAIADVDKARFQELYTKAMNYARKSDLKGYYHRMLEATRRARG